MDFTPKTNSRAEAPCLPKGYFETKDSPHKNNKSQKRNGGINLTPLEKPRQLSYSLKSEKLRRQRLLQNQSKSSRQGTVISPFSERRHVQEISSVCQPMPLQTTGGFFKGKPPITPLTRLGCFRMQTQKTDLVAPVADKRCYTADIPLLAKPKPTQLVHRPATHIPQRCEYHVVEKQPARLKPTSEAITDSYKENSSEKLTNLLPYLRLRSKCGKQNNFKVSEILNTN